MLTKLKNILSEIHLVLTPDREYGKVFERIPIVGFRRAESLKDILVREKERYSRSNNVVYLFSCKTCSKHR